MSKTALAAAAAYSAGKNKTTNMNTSSPKTIKESIASKPLAWFIIAGGVGFLLYKAGKGLSTSVKEWLKGRDFLKEYNNKQKQMKLSYTATQYKVYADSLFDAFVGPGTSLDRIKLVFSAMKNDLDVLELIKSYGTRDGGTYWWSPKMTLIEQIPYDMTDAEITSYINMPLKANGVTYQF